MRPVAICRICGRWEGGKLPPEHSKRCGHVAAHEDDERRDRRARVTLGDHCCAAEIVHKSPDKLILSDNQEFVLRWGT